MLNLCIRVTVAILGGLLLYVGLFLHEDEEGRIQNRLEQLWIRIDDLQQSAIFH